MKLVEEVRSVWLLPNSSLTPKDLKQTENKKKNGCEETGAEKKDSDVADPTGAEESKGTTLAFKSYCLTVIRKLVLIL